MLALTDHDTTGGYAEATAALPSGLTLVPGAEISCEIHDADGRRVSAHLLAYLFDPAEPRFAAERERLVDDRGVRGRQMVARLRDLGVPVTWDEVVGIAGGAPVGRPHVARALVAHGLVPDVSAAFSAEWIGPGGRAYVPKHATDPVEGVRMVRDAGGVAVLAHPAAAGRRLLADDVIAAMAEAGLFGLEVDHVDHPPATRDRLRALARDLGLAATGGSDFHGDHKPDVGLGCNLTDPEVFARLVAAASGAAPVAA